MKKTDKQKLHQSTLPELNTRLREVSSKLVQSIHEIKLNKTKNSKQVVHIRREIATIKTIIRQKQLQAPTNKDQ